MAGPIDALITEWSDDFDTQVADNTANRLDASGEYTYNLGRHIFYENGTPVFDIADTTALEDLPAKFQVTASAGDEHVFAAREIIRYVPNYELLFGAAAWAETALTEGQHFAIEFSQEGGFLNGYRYHFFGTADGPMLYLEQASNGTLVDTYDADLQTLESESDFDHTNPSVKRCYLNWYGAGNARYALSYPRTDGDSDRIADQTNPIIGRTANRDDVATESINQRVQIRVWCEAGADDLTVKTCSLGALIRGNATQRKREKPAILWDIGGSISQYPTDNVGDAIAARIDPERSEVVAEVMPPLFRPAGSGITMELGVYAIHKDHPDLTVNFDDPDDDGTDEGPWPAAQSRASTDVMQYTRDLTSIPTTEDIRADATAGLVPDMRNLTVTVGDSGGRNTPGSTTGGELGGIKRMAFRDDVIIFLPRIDPTENNTSASIRWLKPLFEQDW